MLKDIYLLLLEKAFWVILVLKGCLLYIIYWNAFILLKHSGFIVSNKTKLFFYFFIFFPYTLTRS